MPHTCVVQPRHTSTTFGIALFGVYNGPFLATWTFIQCDQNNLLTSHPIKHFAGYAGYEGVHAAWFPTPFQSEATNSMPTSQHSRISFSQRTHNFLVKLDDSWLSTDKLFPLRCNNIQVQMIIIWVYGQRVLGVWVSGPGSVGICMQHFDEYRNCSSTSTTKHTGAEGAEANFSPFLKGIFVPEILSCLLRE